MIQTKMVEQRACDYCGREAYEWTACLGCGKDLCSPVSDNEAKPHVIRYPHAVSFSGSGDGYYCVPCDLRLSESRSDPLHQAYVAVRSLRDERARYWQEQEKRENAAERNVKEQRAGRGLR